VRGGRVYFEGPYSTLKNDENLDFMDTVASLGAYRQFSVNGTKFTLKNFLFSLSSVDHLYSSVDHLLNSVYLLLIPVDDLMS